MIFLALYFLLFIALSDPSVRDVVPVKGSSVNTCTTSLLYCQSIPQWTSPQRLLQPSSPYQENGNQQLAGDCIPTTVGLDGKCGAGVPGSLGMGSWGVENTGCGKHRV